MAVIGAAAAAQHAEVAEPPAQRAIAAAEIDGVADVEIGGRVELSVATYRCVRPQAPQARGPGLALRNASTKCVGCAQFSM